MKKLVLAILFVATGLAQAQEDSFSRAVRLGQQGEKWGFFHEAERPADLVDTRECFVHMGVYLPVSPQFELWTSYYVFAQTPSWATRYMESSMDQGFLVGMSYGDLSVSYDVFYGGVWAKYQLKL